VTRPSLTLGLLLGLVACAPVDGPVSQPGSDVRSSLPASVLIPGVPFIGWREAALLPSVDKDTTNPSFAASFGMVLRHWGQPMSVLTDADLGLPKGGGGWAEYKAGRSGSIDELKAFLARGTPTIVFAATTPIAHAPSPVVTGLAFGAGLSVGGYGFVSGILGRMVSLDDFLRLRRAGAERGLDPRERVFDADRVAIGYDDHRGVIILHDPSFGPASEVSYSDFLRMWEISGRQYLAIWRREGTPPRPPGPAAYRQPTPDEHAARRFALAYALSSLGKSQEAEEQLRAGLAIEGIGDGYRHLFLLELAPLLAARGDQDAALTAAQDAIALLPEHHRGWKALARILWRIRGKEADDRAGEAETKARNLAVCMPETMVRRRWEVRRLPERSYTPTQRRVATALARHFLISAACTETDVLWMLAPVE